MIDVEVVTLNETCNDGNRIHLYFDTEVGFYVAYGLSAYLVCHVVDPVCSYSEDMQMPVVLLNRELISVCRHSLKKLRHKEHCYYLLELENRLPMDENYMRWAEKLREQWK